MSDPLTAQLEMTARHEAEVEGLKQNCRYDERRIREAVVTFAFAHLGPTLMSFDRCMKKAEAVADGVVKVLREDHGK